MWIVKLEALPNGAHQNLKGDGVAAPPDGWAVIPEDFTVPSTFPFVSIEAEEVTYTREVEVEKEVTKTRETGMVDEDGNPIMEEYTVMEMVKESREYTMMTVTEMTVGTLPEPMPETPTKLEQMEAKLTYMAMMTDTLLVEDSPVAIAMFDDISKWYKQHLWTLIMVKNAVEKNIIAIDEFTMITGEVYL